MKKRAISAVLTAAMLAGVIPSMPVFAEEEPVLLEAQRSEFSDYDDSHAYITMGTVQSEVDERGRYILTIYREGNTDTEASAVLKTADVSAEYGVDYIIDDAGFETETEETGGTLIELSADDENAAEGEAALEEMNRMVSESVGTDDETDSAEEGDEPETAEEADGEEKSSLARLKEEQTGEKTRPLYESEMQPLTGLIGNAMGMDIGEYIETSSSTPIVFAAGETEKQIIIEILEDEEPEGQEIISFMVSEPGENTILAEPMTTSIIINDDEPVVHSRLSFSASEYNAEDGKAEITVRREEALYSYVTAKVRTVEDGIAMEGVNFSRTDADIVLRPYQEETTFEIPVAADTDMSFSVELYDLKGAEYGECMTARVNIASSENDDQEITLFSNDEKEINKVTYTLKDQGNYAELWTEGYPSRHAGDYYYPTDVKSGGNVSYGHRRAESKGQYMDTKKNEYNSQGKYGWLWCDHGKVARIGWEYATMEFQPKKYQSVWVEYETLSTSKKAACGFKALGKDSFVKAENKRAIRGPILCVSNDQPISDFGTRSIEMYAGRVPSTWSFSAPEMKFYGIALMYREFIVDLKQPDEMEFKAPNNTVMRRPATLKISNANKPNGTASAYMGETITFEEKPVDGMIRGTLTGYKIQAGGGASFVYSTSEKSLTFNEELVSLIDRNTKSLDIASNKNSFCTQLSITPIYEYTPVKVDIGKSSYGRFTDANLQKSGTLHVGDTVSMNAEPRAGYIYTTYHMEKYTNPGDSQYQFGGNVNRDSMDGKLVLTERKYILTPNFSKSPNRVEIRLDAEAEKYFELQNVVPDELLPKEDKGKKFLYTEEAAPYTSIIPGRAYKVELTEKEGCNGKYRPRISRELSDDYVNGFVMDFLAKSTESQNVITVTAEQIKGYTDSYVINAAVQYSSVSLRDSSDPLTQEPAIGAVVTAGASLCDLYDKNGNKKKVINRHTAEVDAEGKADVIIENAQPNDRVSVLISNNDVDQVYYMTVTSKGGKYSLVKKTYEKLVADDTKKENKYESVTKTFISCSMQNIDMPIKTPYAPYVTKVDYSSAKRPNIDTRNNLVLMYEDDTITFDAYVFDNGMDIQNVEFILYDSFGNKKQTYKAVENSKEKGRYSAEIESNREYNGYKLYVRVTAADTMLNEEHKTVEIEKMYPMLNTGMLFGLPATEADTSNHIETETGSLGELPVLGDMAADIDTGKLKWRTVDKGNKDTGNASRAEIVTIAVSTDDAEKQKKKLDKLANGKEKEETKKSVEEQLKDFDPFKEASEQDVKQLAREFGEGKTAEERENVVKSWSESKKAEKRKELEKQQKKDSLAKMGEMEIEFKLMVLLQFEYIYDKDSAEYKFVGGQYLIGGSFNVEKTWYWLVYGVPVYIKATGYVSLQADGVYAKKGTDPLTEKELKSKVNLIDADIKSEYPWGQIGVGGKLQPGVGLCGIVGVRGVFTLDVVVRFLTDFSVEHENTSGAMIKMSGGVGVDLFLFSFDYTIGDAKFAWGLYDKGSKMSIASDDSAQVSVRPLDRGSETESDNISIASILSPVRRTDIVTGAMEYVRPEVIDIGDGRLMMVYLRNDTDRSNSANAAALAYRIKDGESWSEPVYVDNDGTADADTAVLRDGDKVYIAWSSADEPVTANGDDLDAVKDNLGMMNIRMAVYDIPSGTMSETVTVTDDEYLNSDVRFAKENDKISLYYFKKDISGVQNVEQLISTTSNYSTWAKRTYDPSAGEFVKLISDGGKEVEEKLIMVKHPSIADPLVYNYAVNDFTYDCGTEDTSDDVSYTVTSYTVDRDGNAGTTGDRGVWLELTDISSGKTYYPIRLESGEDDILNPKFTSIDGDVLLTWLSNSSTLHTISIKSFFDGLKAQTGSPDGSETGTNAYKLMCELTAEEAARPDWGSVLEDKAKPYVSSGEDFNEVFSTISDIVNETIASNPKDFSDDGGESDMSDYQIVIGADRNAYLFWTEASFERENCGRELYGSAYYNVSEEWQEEWGEATVVHGWSDPVQLTDYGEVIDEMTIAVDENKNAVIIANMFEQRIDDAGNVCVGIHKLSEIDCIPTNSLDIVDDKITLSDDYPTAGEKCDISITVKNNGLLASEGQTVSISVIQNGTTVFVDENDEQEEKDVIYPGNKFTYTCDQWVPESLEGDIEIVAEVHEKDTGEVHRASRKLEKAANIEFDSSYVRKADGAITDWAEYDDEESMDDEAKAVNTIINDENVSDFDYIVFIPVSNTGNMPMSDITASAVNIDSQLNEGDVLGTSYAVSLDAKKSGLIAIPVKAGEKYYTDDGLLELMLKVNCGETRLEDGELHQTVYENENVGIIINDGAKQQSMKAGEELPLTVRAYPFDGDKNMFYFSDTPETADVSAEGVVTAVSKGTAVIYAIDLDTGSGSTLEISVDGAAPTAAPTDAPAPTQAPAKKGGGSSSPIANANIIPTAQPQTAVTASAGHFADVASDAWYYETVESAFAKGIMTGVDDKHFAPEQEITRGMFATALYRMEKEPETDTAYTFKDVPESAYYARAVAWASANGIVNGYSDEEFAPNDKITREQMSAMLYRYAKLHGKGFTGAWMFPLSFNDSDEVSEYAYESLCWNTMNGIINGTDGNRLEPKANTTRAQAAAVLIRLEGSL